MLLSFASFHWLCYLVLWLWVQSLFIATYALRCGIQSRVQFSCSSSVCCLSSGYTPGLSQWYVVIPFLWNRRSCRESLGGKPRRLSVYVLASVNCLTCRSLSSLSHRCTMSSCKAVRVVGGCLEVTSFGLGRRGLFQRTARSEEASYTDGQCLSSNLCGVPYMSVYTSPRASSKRGAFLSLHRVCRTGAPASAGVANSSGTRRATGVV